MRLIFVLLAMLATLGAMAQTTTTSDNVTARQRLRVGNDTSRWVSTIMDTVLNPNKRQLITARAVKSYADTRLGGRVIAPIVPLNGQFYKWNSTVSMWVPSDDISSISTTARFTGNGTVATPLELAQQGATNGQVLKWNGTAWAPGVDSVGAGGGGSSSGYPVNIGSIASGITTAFASYGFAPVTANASGAFLAANTTAADLLHQFYVTAISGTTVTVKGSGEVVINSTFAYQQGVTYYLRDDGTIATSADSDGDAIDYDAPCLFVIRALGSNNYLINFYSPRHFAAN